MPAYWLGAFFNPRGLLALLKQEAIKNYCGDRSGNFEQFTFQTDTTFRDFGHVSTSDLNNEYIFLMRARRKMLKEMDTLHP